MTNRPANETGAGAAAGTGESEYELSSFLPYQLSIASNAVSALIAERYRKRFGLKVPEWRVMAVLGDAARQGIGNGGKLTQRDLTEATLMDKVAVNRACKVLESRGLVARAQNVNDGRSHLLELTGEGEAIHREVMPLAKATERELFEGFAPKEEAALRSMLERMRNRAGRLARETD
ncbi:MarR family winged helix-turn-helix transcriptional regulator [uncultured Erythrobacter sp.]|uniref:MarR family winged helix-turn-helix transcriptional regulator n=1 Tax=uncultured Erythrobacter sp. TaxID=263913 RepID=UPI0026230A91|nr:MarR family winged helix-turn-helix transcriptional regulator [uncultured Erythrobacter sp.]